MKFLHIGDVHINKSFVTKDEILSKVLKNRLKKSFFNAVDYAIKENLDALVIAGDLFDHYPIELEAKLWVLDAFKRLENSNVSVLYASGNHDPTGLNSPLRDIDFPKNVNTFFDDQWQIHTITDKINGKQFQFVGCGHIVQHEERPLIDTFPAGNYIGVVHTMVASSNVNNEKTYLPSELKTLKNLNYKYFALGHVHHGGSLDSHQNIYYSGCLMGMNRNETGLKGGYLVEVDDLGVQVEFLSLAAMTYENYSFDVSKYETLEQAFDELIQSLKKAYKDKALDQYFINIILRGKTALYSSYKDDKTIDQFKASVLEYLDLVDIKIINETKTIHDTKAYKHEKSVLGAVLFALDDLKETLDVEEIKLLNKYDEAGLTKLLADMDDDIMTYFLEGYDEN